MTANLTAATAQAQIDHALREANQHRLAHAFELERLSRRWLPALRLHGAHRTTPVRNELGC